jgi:hypothetical protein
LHKEDIKDLGIFLESKRYFHQRDHYLFSAITLLGPIRTITLSFSSLDVLHRFSKKEKNMLLLSGILLPTLTPANQNVSRESFLPHVPTDFLNHNSYGCNYVSHNLKFHTSFEIRRHFEALFIINVSNGFITCPSLLEAVGIRVSVTSIRHLIPFILHF